MAALTIKPADACRWDGVALGEVMLRLDPGDGRIRTARQFRVWEGGGEYNVIRALRRCFSLRTSIVTALPDCETGHLVEDLMLQGGVDLSHVLWRPFDGIGREERVGLNFTERGFGMRPALGCADRAYSSASRMKPGQVDWTTVFKEGVRWFHTGGIFAALSDTTPDVVLEAVQAARASGAIVSYDLNYRASLWQSHGGRERAREVNRAIAPHVDVMLGNEEDFTAALGFEVDGVDGELAHLDPKSFERMIESVLASFPNLQIVGTTLRNARTATVNDWGAVLYADGQFFHAPTRDHLEIYDRVGGGDGFVSGMAYAFLAGKGPQDAVEYGAAHGALAMTTPGDTSMVTLAEVERALRAKSARVIR